MKMIMSRFCSLKMISEYNSRFYNLAAKRHNELLADNAREARAIAAVTKRYRSLWNQIKVELPERERSGSFTVKDTFRITTKAYLGELLPDEVEVQIYYGPLKSVEDRISGKTEVMTVEEDLGRGFYRYGCIMTCVESGRFGFTARVIPRGDKRIQLTPKLITWA